MGTTASPGEDDKPTAATLEIIEDAKDLVEDNMDGYGLDDARGRTEGEETVRLRPGWHLSGDMGDDRISESGRARGGRSGEEKDAIK